jgi:hypothetical protein
MDLAHQHEDKCTNLAKNVFGAKFCQIVKTNLGVASSLWG